MKPRKNIIKIWSEIQMREVEAMNIHEDLENYKTISPTPDMFMNDVERKKKTGQTD